MDVLLSSSRFEPEGRYGIKAGDMAARAHDRARFYDLTTGMWAGEYVNKDVCIVLGYFTVCGASRLGWNTFFLVLACGGVRMVEPQDITQCFNFKESKT